MPWIATANSAQIRKEWSYEDHRALSAKPGPRSGQQPTPKRPVSSPHFPHIHLQTLDFPRNPANSRHPSCATGCTPLVKLDRCRLDGGLGPSSLLDPIDPRQNARFTPVYTAFLLFVHLLTRLEKPGSGRQLPLACSIFRSAFRNPARLVSNRISTASVLRFYTPAIYFPKPAPPSGAACITREKVASTRHEVHVSPCNIAFTPETRAQKPKFKFDTPFGTRYRRILIRQYVRSPNVPFTKSLT